MNRITQSVAESFTQAHDELLEDLRNLQEASAPGLRPGRRTGEAER